MNIDSSIFKVYDIRGVYPDSLNEEIAYRVGKAYSKLLKKENPKKELKIVITNDMRLSSPSLKEALIKGVVESGVDVFDYGLSSTPTFYFTVAYKKYNGGIQISASHNPKEFNGFKLVRSRAVPISGKRGISQIRDWVIENKFEKAKIKGKVTKKKTVVDQAVKEFTKLQNINLREIKSFKIVTDTGNAMAILDLEAMFKNLPCKLIKLNEKLDGNFPVHLADPLKPENLKMAKEEVIEQKADLGIVTDGDGDRYFFLDEKGAEIRQEILRGIMAQISLKEHPGAKICYDIRPGKITKDMIEEAGGIPVLTRVGHSLIKEKMIEEKAPFAGESSGHYYYKFPFGSFDAPIVLTLKFLEWLSRQNKPLSEVIEPYQKYFHSGEINSDVTDKKEKIKQIAKVYKDAKKLNYLDGVTIEYDDFWFNARPSNTENKLRLNLEAVSKKIMEQKRDEILKLIRS